MSLTKAYAVPSVDRALRVLELLAGACRGLSLSEIGRRLGLPKSSAHLILRTLARNGYLYKSELTGKYHLGLKAASLGRSAIENLGLKERARPLSQELMQVTGLTVHLAALDHNEAVIIDKAEPPGLIRFACWVGRRLDVHCTGVGKALIAAWREDELAHLAGSKGFHRHNDSTIVTISALKQNLEQVRRLGYAIDDEEDEIGVRCIGAPILDSDRAVVAAISVCGTTSQIPVDRVRGLGGLVRKAAAGISARLSRPVEAAL